MRSQVNSELSYKNLILGAITYSLLPLAIFLAGFLKWYYSLLSLAGLFAAFRACACRKRRADAVLTRRQAWGLLVLSLVWTWLGGMNGLFYQSSDWAYRNAVFFDLIRFDWPVIYPGAGSALVYYIGFWLPPAVLAKAALALGASQEAALFVGRFTLWLWSGIGIWFVLALLCSHLRTRTNRGIAFVALLFILFSGMDCVGMLLKGRSGELLSYSVRHIEGWSRFQFTSNTACLFWVFNQTIIPWVLTLCFLEEETVHDYVLFLSACLISGPFPAVGLALCMVVKAAEHLIAIARGNGVGGIFRNLRPLSNLLSFFFVFPFVAAFLSANSSFGICSPVPESAYAAGVLLQRLKELAIFLLLEVGIYMLLIWSDHRKDPLFYAIAAIFVLSPCIHVGSSIDFCMRTSIPPLLIVFTYCADFLMKHLPAQEKGGIHSKKKHLIAVILSVCLMLGAVTPLVEFSRGITHVFHEKTIRLEDRSIYTLDGRDDRNFICTDAQDAMFFKYFAKRA